MSFVDLYNMPLSDLKTLEEIATQRLKDEEAKKQHEAEEVEDELEEAVT